ncbi:hypothetical protein PENSPDRAFT_651548 [Peniophora sp. CONT]|nr:hypothetical protein PENSPDRAFT_651548 [Peniophora sp. CONT]
MFAVTRRKESVATLGLGPSLLNKADLLESDLADFFDIQHALFVHLGHNSSDHALWRARRSGWRVMLWGWEGE